MKTKQLTINALLLAVGFILHYVTPAIGIPIKAVIQLKEDLTRARHEDIVLELEHLVNLLSPYNFITFTDKDIEDMRYEYCKWKKLKPVKRKPYTTSMLWWDLMNKPSDMRINKEDENKGDE